VLCCGVGAALGAGGRWSRETQRVCGARRGRGVVRRQRRRRAFVCALWWAEALRWLLCVVNLRCCLSTTSDWNTPCMASQERL
jgi:hypothetical protein